jgi:tellurite methyltransferase
VRDGAHDWPKYYAAIGGRPPHPTLLAAADRFDAEGPRQRRAVDIGSGGGRDTLELLRRGWSVIAVDITREGLDQLRELAGGAAPRLELVHARMEDAEWPVVDLVNSSFTLPFCAPDGFAALWARVVASLPTGGRFAGQLFGPNDSWAGEVLTHSRAEVEALFADFELERLDEFEGEIQSTRGMKHGHIFWLVGRKR